MKAGKDTACPAPAAIALLQWVALLRAEGRPVFPGPKLRQPMTDRALTYPLEQMGRRDLTVHGFRSTFRDWAAETTGFRTTSSSRRSRTRSAMRSRAYRRGDLFEKRVALMSDWAVYLSRPPAEVVGLRAA